jgi:signal peptidase I
MANYFSIILTALTVATGLIWLADAMLWAPKRREKIALAQSSTNGDIDPETLSKIAPLPVLVDNAQQIFPVIAFVLILRSFLYEPFQIPSGSMKPTLLVGDFILVEKFSYGLRDPVARKKFLDTGSPERGDIVVFKYPPNPSQDFIKRLIGMPGDTVIYRNKQFTIKPACDTTQQETCEPERTMPLELLNSDEFVFGGHPFNKLDRYTEELGDVTHDILRNPLRPDSTSSYYRQPGTRIGEWIVPEGHYFMIGDNRDNSGDSRFWGFVPEENLVGKAVAIWISFERDRPSTSWLPSWIPTGVRFNRIGGIH